MHNFIPPNRFFPYLTWNDVQAILDKENTIIIQPVGAIEQHGPHLPLIVDAAIGMGVLGKALEKLDSNIPAFALPMLYYGKSNEHLHFPGTVTLSTETLSSTLMEVGDSIYRAGLRKLVLMNSHGGQPQVMQMVARDLHVKYEDFMVFPLFTWRVPNITKELLTPKEARQGMHAGDAETSIIMALLPEQVKMDKAVAEYPPELSNTTLLNPKGELSFAWTTKDLSKSGVIGDATTATLEKGQQILESVSDGWVKVIKDIYKFQQPKA
ncbi:MAG: creatininase family protein [Rivularia sp. ALOHA_DT_140]|nr:creatininase family protein [Rivularia sp. ALOHA_DT_140]